MKIFPEHWSRAARVAAIAGVAIVSCTCLGMLPDQDDDAGRAPAIQATATARRPRLTATAAPTRTATARPSQQATRIAQPTARPSTPTPTPTQSPAPVAPQRSACSPAYPDVCIPPPPPDLDCGDITASRFTVLPPDPHGFDREGDGVGCESG